MFKVSFHLLYNGDEVLELLIRESFNYPNIYYLSFVDSSNVLQINLKRKQKAFMNLNNPIAK